ncbi:unnamed protein product [Prorocentrum cordatum]|uniref:Clathrin light chain n=1 Tax=Prorocentrum cordatum TaxID=2364126 RepID=A0ABN9U1M5_9DINO|nr:unnamed protein product [Polarella glacialis]
MPMSRRTTATIASNSSTTSKTIKEKNDLDTTEFENKQLYDNIRLEKSNEKHFKDMDKAEKERAEAEKSAEKAAAVQTQYVETRASRRRRVQWCAQVRERGESGLLGPALQDSGRGAAGDRHGHRVARVRRGAELERERESQRPAVAKEDAELPAAPRGPRRSEGWRAREGHGSAQLRVAAPAQLDAGHGQPARRGARAGDAGRPTGGPLRQKRMDEDRGQSSSS